MHLEIKNFSIHLTRKPIKNINLRIKNTGEIYLSAPLKISLQEINYFLESKYSWIQKHSELLKRKQKLVNFNSQNIMPTEQIFFQGSIYQLIIFENSIKQKVELNSNELHLYIKPKTPEEHKRKLLTTWYGIQMQQTLPALFDKWQTIIGVAAIKINIRKMKSRWGSCHPIKKHITINLCLIEKPLICLEYVIVHELVHLLEASHNQRFYQLMDYYMPGWQKIRKELTSLHSHPTWL